ncbi:beta-fructofuranosidase [Marchantia polymorpha subsp. ruderalis]|nr:hypothetical protein MARPO_0088s0025 [Marchantia polymorpha]BBN15995.1 hypothetical protein Mp_7g02630 [Marchantia polymorpha subsp. ruderalis]|eukprot:PTQ33476.1 hypothetical protein MARPO_0088s0025 [Marchantia polymorpha]
MHSTKEGTSGSRGGLMEMVSLTVPQSSSSNSARMAGQISQRARRRSGTVALVFSCCVVAVVLCMVFLVSPQSATGTQDSSEASEAVVHNHHHHHGVSFQEVKHRPSGVHADDQQWGESKATYQATMNQSLPYRTAFHFQPTKNWMNDPNGMMYYKGWYHLFYQYNPYGALWGNIVWGHAVSKDLVHWKYVDDDAIVGGPKWYDLLGAWSGSTTFLEDGTPALLYTGWSNVSSVVQIQTQNLALPVDKEDPLLRKWYKSEANPVMVAEPWMDATKYRDPTEAWKGKDGLWRTLIGARLTDNVTGTSHLYKSKDFVNWTYSHDIHMINGTGMWECPDFFPVALKGKSGLDVSVSNGMVKHVMKVSLDNNKHDYYSVGTYNEQTDEFKGDSPSIEVGIGLRYDYGKFYASKTFFDKKTNRRILWGWCNESDSDNDALTSKGWSGIQALPRQIWLDPATQVDLIQVPVEEVDGLHRDKVSRNGFTLTAGAVMPMPGVHGPQLDIQIKFLKPKLEQSNALFEGSDVAALEAQLTCSRTGAAHRGYLGPFGVLVLADEQLQEQTAVFFYLQVLKDGTWKGLICSDQSRSSMQDDVDKTVYGTYVRVLESEKYLSMRTIVDHSVVETFAQGGRTVVTSRVYPTVAVDQAAHFFLFNNGSQDVQVHSFNAWRMESVHMEQLQF